VAELADAADLKSAGHPGLREGMMASLKRSLEKLLTVAPVIARETKLTENEVERVFTQAMLHAENNKRQPAPQPPEGCISLRAASAKYGIPHPTLSVWINKKKYIPILLRTKNKLFVSEVLLVELINKYRKNPGQGKHTLRLYD